MDTANTTQLKLPLTFHETRAAKLERLLSGKLAKHVKRASELTFTEQAAREATERATDGELEKLGPSGGLA